MAEDLPPLSAETIERFKRDWYAATGSACADKALVALSGGPDSSALLLLCASARAGLVKTLFAATVDHGLRPTSSAEAGRAADLARRCGVPHRILSGDLPARVDRTANISARARALRYELLEEHAEEIGARWIVTAHHADDQLETVVMRLNRGAGVGGLSGIRLTHDKAVRPLLRWRRDELAAIVAATGLVAVNDPSNTDDRYDRARLRKALAGADWLDPLAAARSAQALAEADAALDYVADMMTCDAEHWGRIVTLGTASAAVRATFLPAELKRRLVLRCLRHVRPYIVVDGNDLTRLIERLERELAATLGGVQAVTTLAPAPLVDMQWVFREAPPRRAT